MRHRWIPWTVAALVIPALGLVAVLTQSARAEEGDAKEAAKLPQCPVMDESIDPTLKVATDDGPVYFCCPGCIKKHKENPEKYAERVAAQRKELKDLPKVQVTCPISDEPINKEVYSEKGGEKVYFCCPRCKGKYEENPDKYATQVANSMTIQTKCPLSGQPISPDAFVDFTSGHRIYFCCNRCTGKIKADAAGFVETLRDKGIYINPDKLKEDS